MTTDITRTTTTTTTTNTASTITIIMYMWMSSAGGRVGTECFYQLLLFECNNIKSKRTLNTKIKFCRDRWSKPLYTRKKKAKKRKGVKGKCVR